MATALDIIKRSLRLLGVYSIGETPTAEESADALSALNSMVDSWANDNLFIYAKTLDQISLTANVSTYTVGPSGGTVSPRPTEVSSASYIDFQGVSYPLAIATLNDFNSISVKTQVLGIPSTLYVLPNMPNVSIQLWPVPSASMTLNLWSNKLIQSFANLTDVLTLPPGYERALSYSLAEEIAPEYAQQASADIKSRAMQSLKMIRRTNVEVPRLGMPSGIPRGRVFVNYRNA